VLLVLAACGDSGPSDPTPIFAALPLPAEVGGIVSPDPTDLPCSMPGSEPCTVAGASFGVGAAAADIDPFEFVRVIAVARVLMPRSHVRLSAGRTGMSPETQALAFFAGANSIFYGEKLLTTPNPEASDDMALLERLGLSPEPHPADHDDARGA
jgi:hypothetical protein